MPSAGAVRQVFLFDNPRTCSQLLHRMFSFHPQLDTTSCYQWATSAATSGPERMQLRVKSGDRAKAADADLQEKVKAVFGPMGVDFENETYDIAADRRRGAVETSYKKDGKTLFVKEHVACCLKPEVMGELLQMDRIARPPANPTAIPDEIFAHIKQPIFLIRHPALVIPSQWRAQRVNFAYEVDDEGFKFFTMQCATRFLFDHMRDKDPIVIDADDVVHRSEALCERLCGIWGIDPSGVRYTWDKVSLDNGPQHPGARYYVGTLYDSTAPIRPVQQGLDIEAEFGKWKVEYGFDVANALLQIVRSNMMDYEYLRQFRMKI